jgi:hypothetical protein
MENKGNYFSRANKLFWGLIIVIIIFSIFNFNSGIFKSDDLAKDIIRNDSLSKINWDDKIVENDTTAIPIDTSGLSKDTSQIKKIEYIYRTWKWKSFDGKNYTLNFRIIKSDYYNAINCRETSDRGLEIWSRMYQNDKLGLKEMVNGYRKIIKDNNLNGMAAINMVVTSVQSIPYVLISDEECPTSSFGMEFTNDCKPRVNSPSGCCGYILPFGVYSPIEYAVNGSGDCDTKSLFACTILKELNLGYYDVAMLTGDVEAGAHAMVGVNIMNPPYNDHYVTDIRRNKYYAWEATCENNELGMRVWKTWKNWIVVNL